LKAENDMGFAVEGILKPGPAYPVPKPKPGRAPHLNVSVVFTSVEATLGALREAGVLATGLSGQIVLLVPQAVPFPLPLTSPPVLVDWSERRFRVLAASSPVETAVRIYYCRDRTETLLSVLNPHSLVVVGGPKRWWPTGEQRLVRTLRGAGHEVIFKETE
jgi:hypothetical protein